MKRHGKKRSCLAFSLALQLPATMAAVAGATQTEPPELAASGRVTQAVGSLQRDGHTRTLVFPGDHDRTPSAASIAGSMPVPRPVPGPENGWFLGVGLAFIAPRPRAAKVRDD